MPELGELGLALRGVGCCCPVPDSRGGGRGVRHMSHQHRVRECWPIARRDHSLTLAGARRSKGESMGFFDKKPSFSALKGAVAEAATKISDTAKSVDVQAMVNQAKELASSTADQAVDLSRTISDKAVEGSLTLAKSVADTLESVDTAALTQSDFYKERYLKYQEITAAKLAALYKSTFELDRDALDMVQGLKAQMPAPAQTADEIFERCRQEALRRAVSAFALGGVMSNIDQHSAAKYANLSQSYDDYKGEIDYAGKAHPPYTAMSNQRDAQPRLGTVVDGYNRADPLPCSDADVEHVVSRKQIYQDGLLRIGTTDAQMADVMNDPRNLIFANRSLNGSKGDKDLMAYLGEYGRQDPSDPDRIIVTIKTTKQEVSVSRADAEAAYEQAHESLRSHQLEAAKEVGATLVKTGATMAAQQVVGLIVLETADIFVDETKALVLRDGALD